MRERSSPQRSAVSGRVMKMKVRKSKTDKEVSAASMRMELLAPLTPFYIERDQSQEIARVSQCYQMNHQLKH